MPRTGPTESTGEPPVTPDVGIQLLKSLIDRARILLASRPLSEDVYSQWDLLARNYLEKAFGASSPNVSSVADVGKWVDFPLDVDEEWWENHRVESLTTQASLLEGLVDLLETEVQLRRGTAISRGGTSPNGYRLFLAHGRDEAALQEVARFLERLDQHVIVLREQPNQGRTIIEKFEDYSDVGFAVVLLTPDDRGGLASAGLDEQRHRRARQNVILELGYFLGRLGRSRVCALYREGVEIPSDYSGVLYVKLDADGGWRLQLAKELKAAGLPVDINKAL